MNYLQRLSVKNFLRDHLLPTAMIIVLLIIFSGVVLSLPRGQLKSNEGRVASVSSTKPAVNLILDTKKEFPQAKEILEKRTRYSKTSVVERLPDGRKKYALDSSAGPVHYKDAVGAWQEIDVALLPTEGEWDYSMEKADYSFFVKKTMNSEKLVEFQKNGEYVRFAPVSLRVSSEKNGSVAPSPVTGEVQDNEVSWPNVFGEGTKLSWTALPESLNKILEIEDYSYINSLGEEESLEFTLKFEYSDGVQALIGGKAWDGKQIETKDEVEFRDKEGNRVWSFRKPTAWDSDNNFAKENFFRIENIKGDFYVTHVIPSKWLKLAKFPVSIDVDLCSGSCAVDPPTDDGYTGTGTPPFFSNSIGFSLTGNDTNGDVYHSFTRFEGISGLGGSTIESAYMSVTAGAFIDDAPPGGIYTLIRAEKAADPSVVTSYDDYISKLSNNSLTSAYADWSNPGWGCTICPQMTPSLVDVISEVAGYDPSAIQIMHLDNGSGVVGSNYMYYFSQDNSNPPPLLHVTYTGAPAPDFMITETRSYATPAIKIIASNYPPRSTSGSRVFSASTTLRLHGWVKNTTGPAGDVELCFYEESQGVPGPSPPCATQTTIKAPPGGWQGSPLDPNFGTPFGTACADVTGDGRVTVEDIYAVVDNYGGDPNYDLDDDGNVNMADVLEAIKQNEIFCDRNVNITTSSVVGDYGAWGWVDMNNAYPTEQDETNNYAGADGYKLVADPLRTLDLTQKPKIKLEPDNFLNTDFTATLDATTKPPGWNISTTKLDLSIINTGTLPAGVVVGFGTKDDSSGWNTLVDPVAGGPNETKVQIPFFVDVPAGTSVGSYTFDIKVDAEQTEPSFFVSETMEVTVEVTDKVAWFKTENGDVGAKGRLASKSPSTSFQQTNSGASTLGQMWHDAACVGNNTSCGGTSAIFPAFRSTFLTPGAVGANDLRPPVTNPMYRNRSYLTFDTSSIAPGSLGLGEAKLKLKLGVDLNTDLVVEVYTEPSLDWTDPELANQTTADQLWHETNQKIVNDSDVTPDASFSLGSSTCLDVQGAWCEVGIPLSSINEGGLTQMVLIAEDETTWASGYKLISFSDTSFEVSALPVNGVNTDYLGISDRIQDPFYSAVNWLVPGYSSSGGLNYSFTNDSIFEDFWQKFGGNVSSTPVLNGAIPVARGVYAYPSAAAIDNAESPVDFTWNSDTVPTDSNPVVLFINGDLNIDDELDLANKKVVFVVRGDVKVSGGVENGQDISFGYAVHTGGSGTDTGADHDIHFLPGSSGMVVVEGDVFAKGQIPDPSAETCLNSPPPYNCTIDGDASTTYGFGDDETCRDTFDDMLVTGDVFCEVTSVERPWIDEQFWKDEAANYGSFGSVTISGQTNYELKGKYGNVDIEEGSIVTVTGPVHITGRLTIIDSTIKLDDSFGSSGTVVLISGSSGLQGSASIFGTGPGPQVLGNNANPPGYLLFYMTSSVNSSSMLGLKKDKPNQAIFYAKNAKMRISGFVGSGCDENNLPQIAGAVLGSKGGYGGSPSTGAVHLGGCLKIIEDVNLSTATFSTEPSAALSKIDGFFVSDGQFISGRTDVPIGTRAPNNLLTVNGAVLAQGGFDLGRDLGDENQNAPAELIIYDPSYLYLFATLGTGDSLLGDTRQVVKEVPP